MTKKKKYINAGRSINPNMSNITQKWVNLLVPFTSGYNQRFTQSELSRLSGIPQQTSSRYLDSLVKKGLISYEAQGRNKLFYIDLNIPTANALIQTIESHKALEFHQRVKDVSISINELLGYAESIILFGSYSAYTFSKDSDIDIIIAGKAEKDKIKAVKQRSSFQINEQYISYKELAESLESKKPLAIEIIKNHILFGDTSKLIKMFMGAAL